MKYRLFYVTLLAGLLSACVSSPQTSVMYLLGDAPAEVRVERVDGLTAGVILGELRLAPFLDQQGLVYQTEPRQIQVASNHRWASPLLFQLRQEMVQSLGQSLVSLAVFDGAAGAPDGSRRLDIEVEAFHGHFDGHTRVSGDWRLRDTGGAILQRGRFASRTALQGDGYDALVEALAQGWNAAASDIAQQISP